MTALYVHLAILWAAFFGMVAPPRGSPIIRPAKRLGAITFAVIVIETLFVPG